MSLRIKVVILPVIISVATLGTMGYLAAREVSRWITAQVQEEALLTVSIFDADIETLEAVLDFDQIQSRIEKLVAERPEIVEFTLNGPVYGGTQIAGYRTLASSDPTLIWTEIRPEIEEVIARNEVAAHTTTSVDGQPAVGLIAPIHVAGEAVAAIEVIAVIEADGIEDAARDRALWIAYVVDASLGTTEGLLNSVHLQRMITDLTQGHPEITTISLHGPVYQQPPVLEYRKTASTNRQVVGELSELETVASITSDETVLTTVVMDGEESLQVVAPIHVARKPVATVDVLISLDEVRAETGRIARLFTLATLAAITLMTILLVTLLGRVVIRPISRLTTSAQAMAAGDLLQEVSISSKDELGVLANAFNSMADQLRDLISSLEQRVAERTAELTTANEQLQREITERMRAEEQLQRYANELAQANEEVKQFAYIVSHDLRAPLVNLKGFAAELRSALEAVDSAMETALPHLDEKQRQDVTLALQEDVPEALGFINSSVTHMDDFINAVLKLSRLGRRELTLEPINMNDLVQKTLETVAHQLEARQATVTVGPLPQIIADRTSMEQIMGNLLGNAVKYLDPDRPGEIEITAQRGDDETTFHIRDNGRGIAEEDMPKVFAPFRRVGRQDVPGEGMGLPYVQALVRRHGGRIWCESELGVGTTFTFTIPNHELRR